MTRALVTGATGFIGTHVVRALIERGHEVTALARTSSAAGGVTALGARIVHGDLGDAPSLARAVGDADVVLHLATVLKVPWKPEFRSLNIDGTAALASACAARTTPPPLVIVSSLAAGGPSRPERPRTEADGAQPISRYGRMKLDAERAARAMADRLPITVIRPPMVFGDGDRWTVPLFASALRGVHLVPTWRAHRLSLVHARDLADAIARAASSGERARKDDEQSGVYYVAAGDRPTYAELGAWIAEACGARAPFALRIPGLLTGLVAAVSEGLARLRDRPTLLNLDKWREATAGSWICDPAKAHRELGWSPAPTRARLAETAAAYRAAGWL